MSAWVVTGTSGGLGRELVLALLARDIPVVATARKLESIKDLEAKGARIAQWDVTDPLARLQATAAELDAQVGGVGVLVNNAGFLIAGPLEETTPEDDQKIFGTNVFGLYNTTRAFLPHFRKRKAGTIVNISSLGGLMGHAGSGLYNSTKYAVEGITAALSKEVAHLGITALVVEPGYFRTNFMTSSPESTGAEIEDYKVITGPSAERRKAAHGKQPGDPVKGANVIIDVVLGVGVAEGRKAPAQFPLGPDAVAVMQNVVDAQQKIINDWKDISSTTNFD